MVCGNWRSACDGSSETARRLREYFDESIRLTMAGSSILEDRQVWKQARKLCAEQLQMFISFCDTEAPNLKEDGEVDMGFVFWHVFVVCFLMSVSV